LKELPINKQGITAVTRSEQSEALAADGNFPLAANSLQRYEQITLSPANLEAVRHVSLGQRCLLRSPVIAAS
jgi:hypothetical protein